MTKKNLNIELKGEKLVEKGGNRNIAESIIDVH
jgi:hypothetical protein